MNADRISYYSQRMATITLGLIFVMLILNAASWLSPALNVLDNGEGTRLRLTNELITHLNIDVEKFPWWQTAGSIFLSSVPLITLANGLRHLRFLFQCYGRKEYFSPATASHLGSVGKWVGIWVILNMLCQPLLSAWSTMLEPVGHRTITMNFGSSDIVALFIAASIAIIAHILRQASELDAENRQFI